MIKLAHPIFLFLYMVIPVLLTLYILTRINRKNLLLRFGNPHLIDSLHPLSSPKKVLLKLIIQLIVVFLIITAIVDPLSGSKLEKAKRKGAELMICLDVSNSMYAEDIKPNRIARAKQALSKLVDKLEGDNIGLVIFAGKPFVQLPITSDYGAAKLFISTVSPDLIPVQGTAIGEAIMLAAASFKTENEKKKNRAIIIISDGENHQDDAILAASEAYKQGISVYTIGMGLPEGAPIPIHNGMNVTYKKDMNGNTVISRLDESLLQKIAAAGNGTYVRASNAEVGLNTIFDEINKLEKDEMESHNYSDFEDHFQIFVFLAILLMIIDLFIFERKFKWKKGFNLFKSTI